jgi:hypothetical protein
MIHDSMKNNCLHMHPSCMEDMIHDQLHASVFHHLSCRWRAHIAIGVDRPWISCCCHGRGCSGGGGGSGCGRISCCGGNGCGCGYRYGYGYGYSYSYGYSYGYGYGYDYGYGSGGDGGSGGGKFYLEYT